MFKRGKKEQQITLDNPLMYLPKSLQDNLRNSWADSFFTHVFLQINEDRFAPLYSSVHSRPNKPVNLLVSLLILKEYHGLTDDELVASLYFDYRYQYALGINRVEDEGLCINTLTNFRHRLLVHENETKEDLLQQEMKALSEHFAHVVHLDKSLARMDSFMLSSSCKKLSRLELVYRVLANTVKTMNHVDPSLVTETFKPYLTEGHQNQTLYHTRNHEAGAKIDSLFAHASELYDQASRIEEIRESESFRQLTRLLQEQCYETEEGVRISIEGDKIKSNSMQSPVDADATYRNKGGKDHVGYAVNLVEVRDKEKKLGLILDYEVKPNIHSDAEFGECFVKESPLAKEINTLAVDGAYYRPETLEAAPSIEINFSNMSGRKQTSNKMSVDRFAINEQKQITACPAGYQPVFSQYDQKKMVYTAKFDKTKCQTCPMLEECPLQNQKKYNTIRFTETKLVSDRTRSKIGTERHRELSRFRAGIEGVVSALRRGFHIEEIPVFGFVRLKTWVSTKIVAYNFKKLMNYQARLA